MAQSLRRPTALFLSRRHDWNYFASVPVFRLCDARAWFRARRFMYPHTMTGVLSANSADTVKKNAVFLPAYTLLLGLIALLGLMAIAAGIQPEASSDVVPALIRRLFPS